MIGRLTGLQVAVAIAVLFCAVFSAVPAVNAQTSTARPYRGLFGGTAPDDTGGGLQTAVTVVQGYDDNLLAETGTVRVAETLGGHYTMLMGSGAYSWEGRRFQLGASAEAGARYFAQLRTVQSVGHSAALGFSVQLPKKTTLFVNQKAAYSPAYLYGLFPSLVEGTAASATPIAADYAVNDQRSYSFGTVVRFTHGLTRRGSLAVTADYGVTDYLHNTQNRRDVERLGGSVSFSRSMGRSTGLRIGYRYVTGQLGQGTGDTNEHGLTAGVNYSRPLSSTRRAVLRFNLGSSTVEGPLSGLAAASGAVGPTTPLIGRRYRVVGDAGLEYDFSRTWQARASYRRGLDYIAELADAVFVDGFASSLGGNLSRRTNLWVSAGYSSGEPAAYRQTSQFDTYTGSLRLGWVPAGFASTFAEYFYYYYDFSGTPQLLPDAPSTLARNGVRVGVTVWVPAPGR